MEHCLKSLRNLEERLTEALEDLGQRSALVRALPPETEQRQASVNPWGWATPDAVRRRQESHRPTPPDSPLEEHDHSIHPPAECSELPGNVDPPGEDSGLNWSNSPNDQSDSDQSGPLLPPPQATCGHQVVVNGYLDIPAGKPDAEVILRFKPVCRVTNWQCVHTEDGRQVVVTGKVEIGVEYVANLPDQPRHFVHFVVPFHTLFPCSGPIQGIHCRVEFKHSELLTSRTISKVILLRVGGIHEE